jgi:hypothetical protein
MKYEITLAIRIADDICIQIREGLFPVETASMNNFLVRGPEPEEGACWLEGLG